MNSLVCPKAVKYKNYGDPAQIFGSEIFNVAKKIIVTFLFEGCAGFRLS
jgi:hypothetical protein